MQADCPDAPFVGRERELSELRVALETALVGEGRLVVIGGEPGIGKTRLARAVAATAAGRGIPVCWGGCWEAGAPAFWPWTEALERWMCRTEPGMVAAAIGPLPAHLAHVGPALRDLLRDLPVERRWESDQARLRAFAAVSRLLGTIAADQGLVLVLDDMHWADQGSLKLLQFVARDLPDLRVLVLALYRDTDLRRDVPLFASLPALAREPVTRRLRLSGLEPAECARYVAISWGKPLDGAIGLALHQETNGNPFFLGEIVRWLAKEDPSGLKVDRVRLRPLPRRVQEAVSTRLDRLGDPCRTVLAVGALCGEAFDASFLAAVLMDEPETRGQALVDALERAMSEHILTERPDGRYAFAHALIRDVLIDALGPARRSAWHGRIARGAGRDEGCRFAARGGGVGATLRRRGWARESSEGLHVRPPGGRAGCGALRLGGSGALLRACP